MPITIDNITYTEGLTHPATFHADDVFATALLKLIAPTFPVRRDVPETATNTTLVFDQGGGQFDHHGQNPPKRENGTPYSSFGLLWEKLGSQLCHPNDTLTIDNMLVQPIDISDNTGEFNIVSTMINDIQTMYEKPDDGFNDAVQFAQGILQRRIHSLTQSRNQAREAFRQVKLQNDPQILVLDKWLAGWWRATKNRRTLFCVFPSMRGGWAAQGVKSSESHGETLCPYPNDWCAKTDTELQAVSGIPDAIFCHKSGFIAVAKSKEGAIAIAQKAIDENPNF